MKLFLCFEENSIISTMFILLILLTFIVSPQAQATTYTWADQKTGVSLTFPDNWTIGSNQKTDDIITVQAPGARDYASCRLRQRTDHRTDIYPSRYDFSLQHLYISYDFWRDYIGEYSGAVLQRILWNRGLLNSVAGSADYTFLSSAGAPVLMRGFSFAAYSNKSLFIFECSSEYQSYEKWHPVFRSILKSGWQQMTSSAKENGSYREFQQDKPLRILGGDLLDFYK